jgi:hypothetical protein
MGGISSYGGAYLDPVYALRKPTPADNQYRIDQEWVDQSVAPHVVYKLTHIDWSAAPYPATWEAVGGGQIEMYDVTDPDLVIVAATMTIATSTVTSVAHGLREESAIVFAGAGLPPEIVAGVTYYTFNDTVDTFELTAAPGVGPALVFSANGVGTYTTLNGAVDTPIVDFYDGVNITTTQPQTAAGQTIQDPSDVAAHHVFTVVNNDASTDPITIYNGSGPVSTVLMPGQAQKYIWDGAEWTLGTGIDAEDIDYTPHGEVPDVNVQSAINKLIDIRWMKRFYNASGGILAANKVVKLNGYDAGSTEAFIIPVTATADVPCGFLTAAVGIATTGYALIKGEHISVLDTSAGAINDPVYFTAAGDLTLIPGSAVIGRVLTVGNPGTVFIDVPADATSGKLGLTTATDPALNGIDITFVDPFDGVVITLTAAGNSQTLPAPTDTTAGKEFVVIGNDTNGAFSVPVVYAGGTLYVHAAEAASFVWDGTAWAVSQDTMFTDDGEYLTPKSTDRTVRAASTARLVTRVESGIVPAATTYTDIGLVVAAGHTVKDACVVAVNMSAATRYVRIAHVLGGAPIPPLAPNDEMFVCYDFEMDPNFSLGWMIPTIHAGDIIAVYADGDDVTFRVSGNDIAAVKSDEVEQYALADALLNDIFTMGATAMHLEDVKIVNRSAVDTVVTIYAKEAATAAAVDAVFRFEIPANLWVTLRDLEANNLYLGAAQKLSAQAAVGGNLNIITYAK